MTRPTVSRTFHYDVAATVTAVVAGIVLMALTPGVPLEFLGKTLFAGGLLTAVTIAFIDAAGQHRAAPTTGDPRD